MKKKSVVATIMAMTTAIALLSGCGERTDIEDKTVVVSEDGGESSTVQETGGSNVPLPTDVMPETEVMSSVDGAEEVPETQSADSTVEGKRTPVQSAELQGQDREDQSDGQADPCKQCL